MDIGVTVKVKGIDLSLMQLMKLYGSGSLTRQEFHDGLRDYTSVKCAKNLAENNMKQTINTINIQREEWTNEDDMNNKCLTCFAPVKYESNWNEHSNKDICYYDTSELVELSKTISGLREEVSKLKTKLHEVNSELGKERARRKRLEARV